jgi:hypothetical protein
MEDTLAVIFLFGGGTLFLLAISPIGRAIADRIRGTKDEARGRGRGTADADAEIDALRREVAELAERVDFIERLQAKPRDPERLAPPR